MFSALGRPWNRNSCQFGDVGGSNFTQNSLFSHPKFSRTPGKITWQKKEIRWRRVNLTPGCKMPPSLQNSNEPSRETRVGPQYQVSLFILNWKYYLNFSECFVLSMIYQLENNPIIKCFLHTMPILTRCWTVQLELQQLEHPNRKSCCRSKTWKPNHD